MQLKRLELSGFKSFARTTVLEFPARITAIVGPNGSGKSNIAEAIRWVLGEQSMKSLRGKRGEDLIWNGSPQLPRMGKAAVTLHFDNREKTIPVDFDEVVLGRKIFRDGLNEYSLNDSQVRLKDVVELLARMGLGETKHNIIGQGEVDRVLLASPLDRRALLEEALGLRVYHLKKREAERKLEATQANVTHVESLLREIRPHLKFLRSQTHKASARETVDQELKYCQRAYVQAEWRDIQQARLTLERDQNPLAQKQQQIRENIHRLNAEVEQAEASFAKDLKAGDDPLAGPETKRRELERELGRLEGKLEAEKARPQPPSPPVDTQLIREEIRHFIDEFRTILEEDRIEVIKSQTYVLLEDLERLVEQIGSGSSPTRTPPSPDNGTTTELKQTIHATQQILGKLAAEIEAERLRREQTGNTQLALRQKIREMDGALRARQEEERGIALQLERFRFEAERLQERERTLREESQATGIDRAEWERSEAAEGRDLSPVELKRKMERLRAKLEEIGGIDPSVIQEYQEVEARHTFLTGEVKDLEQAIASLRQLIRELEKYIQQNFTRGFAKIRDEFHNYFRIIFGGGKAALRLVSIPLRSELLEEDASSEASGEGGLPANASAQEGIEIEVDLPRKRIRGLAMLSGGERALTSAALLFAVSAVNPPPFLVLDETDAALDEVNSARYAAILKELAKKTQLILVTHNRETMQAAGLLYGVMMGEDGVSNLISLKLEEAEVYTNH